jgi:hypothetical protein
MAMLRGGEGSETTRFHYQAGSRFCSDASQKHKDQALARLFKAFWPGRRAGANVCNKLLNPVLAICLYDESQLLGM